MVVLDMDDTLLNDDHQISVRNKKAILKAQQKGVYVVLASGRPTPAMILYAQELELDINDSYLLSYNGAQILQVRSQKVIFEQNLDLNDVYQLTDYCKQYHVDIITYLDHKIISEKTSPYIEIEKSITGMDLLIVPDFKEFVRQSVTKCLLLSEPSHLASVTPTLQSLMPHLNITTSKPFFLEVTQKGIDKAASLAKLGFELNIKPEEMIAVGNASNDLSMIQFAGLGIWVDNVQPDLRDKAQVIVSSNNDDGVAEAIEKYILD